MIAAANREIRRHHERARQRRREAMADPHIWLDRRIASLERMHLEGFRRVPPAVQPWLLAVNAQLPSGLHLTIGPRCLIRDAIDRCFDLQERLLTLHEPDQRAVAANVGEDDGQDP
jgi:hypothetical protein